MSKPQTIYTCSRCGAQSLKWNGRCLECGAWGTLEARTIGAKEAKTKKLSVAPAEIVDFNEETQNLASPRIKTNISEVDRVLGGGIVPGSLILLSGEPGIGKSTIVAQIANAVANLPSLARRGLGGGVVFYASGEESVSQVKARFKRLKCGGENIKFIPETNVEKIIAAINAPADIRVGGAHNTPLIKGVRGIKEAGNDERPLNTPPHSPYQGGWGKGDFKNAEQHPNNPPALLIIDSIQTVYTSAVESEPGSISQIRASAANFLEMAKRKNIPVILIGHITKDGAIAGPKSLEHIVDTVIYLEAEEKHNYRILRATKNRFGSINELGIFEMTDSGFKEIKNPGAIFLEATSEKISGSVISCIIEGTRPFLVEIQALVTKTVFGYPQRKASGFDLNRLQVLIAVLTKRAKINLTNQDVILNVVGGLKINDPALDLPVCLAITSSLLNQVVDRKTICLGEVGLGGEIRNVSKLEQRLNEAEKLGFTKAIVPDCDIKAKKIKLEKVKNINEIVKNF
jgi:DNA repair protein RadA/Sms